MAYPCQLICNDTHRINRPLLMPVTISMPEPSIGPGIRSSGSLNHSSNLRLSTSQRKSERNNKNKSTKRRPASIAQSSGQRMTDVFRAASIEDVRICGDWSFGASQFLEWPVSFRLLSLVAIVFISVCLVGLLPAGSYTSSLRFRCKQSML